MIHEQSEHRMMGPFGPGLEEVNNFFTANDFPAEEGEVFFYYYQAMDWRNENGVPVRDWRTAASDWLFNLDH